MKLSREKLLDMYEKMALSRAFEETAMKLFSLGKVHGTAHFCIGEEAPGWRLRGPGAPGPHLCHAPWAWPEHQQGHGREQDDGGVPGKAAGVCKGKGGCMHIADISAGKLGANGIVGGGIPIAVGAH